MRTRATRGRMAAIEKKTKRYPSDLTDEEWSAVEPLLPHPANRGRKRAMGAFGEEAALDRRPAPDLPEGARTAAQQKVDFAKPTRTPIHSAAGSRLNLASRHATGAAS
jgi:hypothetical protein